METESPGNGCQAFRELGKPGCELAQGGTGRAPLYDKDTYFSVWLAYNKLSSHDTRTPAYTAPFPVYKPKLFLQSI